ncbi:MAG: MFS transporter, partial [Elusimicrobiota bacterium]
QARRAILKALQNAVERDDPYAALNALWMIEGMEQDNPDFIEALRSIAKNEKEHELAAYAAHAIAETANSIPIENLTAVLPPKIVLGLIRDFGSPNNHPYVRELALTLAGLFARKGKNARDFYFGDAQFSGAVKEFLAKYETWQGDDLHFATILTLLEGDSLPTINSQERDASGRLIAGLSSKPVHLIAIPRRGTRVGRLLYASDGPQLMALARQTLGFDPQVLTPLGAELIAALPNSESRRGALIIEVNDISRIAQLRSELGKLGIDSRLAKPVKAYLHKTGPLSGVPEIRQKYGYTGKGVVAAIIDNGMAVEHPSFGGRVIAKRNFINKSKPDEVIRGEHGTHVAGIVGAEAVYGAPEGGAPDVKFVIAQVLDPDTGSGSEASVMMGMEWVMDLWNSRATKLPNDIRAMTANMSLGGPGNADSSLSRLADKMVLADIDMNLAAGNSGGKSGDGQIGQPASSRESSTVGAMKYDKTTASFSSRGPARGKEGDIDKPDWLDFGNPVRSVKDPASSRRGDQAFTGPNGQTIEYLDMSGTSMATPETTGKKALMLEAALKAFEASGQMVLPQGFMRKLKVFVAALVAEKGNLNRHKWEQGAGSLDKDPMLAILDQMPEAVKKNGDLPVRILDAGSVVSISVAAMDEILAKTKKNIVLPQIVVPRGRIYLTDGARHIEVGASALARRREHLVEWHEPFVAGFEELLGKTISFRAESRRLGARDFVTILRLDGVKTVPDVNFQKVYSNQQLSTFNSQPSIPQPPKPKVWLHNLKAGAYFLSLDALGFLLGYVTIGLTAGPWLGLLSGIGISLAQGAAMLFFVDNIMNWLTKRSPITRESHPEIVRMVEEILAREKELTGKVLTPKIYLLDKPNFLMPPELPNAFATGRSYKKCSVTFTTGILKLMNPATQHGYEELKAVVGHEIGHIAHRDVWVNSIGMSVGGLLNSLSSQYRGKVFPARTFAKAWYFVLANALTLLGNIVHAASGLAVSRDRELNADYRSIWHAGISDFMIRSLLRLRYGASVPALFGAGLAPINLAHCFGELPPKEIELFSTHPSMRRRVERLLPWASESLRQEIEKMFNDEKIAINPKPALVPPDAGVGPKLTDSKKWPFGKLVFSGGVLGVLKAVLVAGLAVPASVVMGALSIVGFLAEMVILDVLVMWPLLKLRGPKLTDEQFYEHLQTFHHMGAISSAVDYRPLRLTLSSLFLWGASNGKVHWWPTQLIGFPQKRMETERHLAAKDKAGRSLFGRLKGGVSAFVSDIQTLNSTRQPAGVNIPRFWLVLAGRAIFGSSVIAAGAYTMGMSVWMAPLLYGAVVIAAAVFPFFIMAYPARAGPQDPLKLLSHGIFSKSPLARLMSAQTIASLASTASPSLRNDLTPLLKAQLSKETDSQVQAALQKAIFATAAFSPALPVLRSRYLFFGGEPFKRAYFTTRDNIPDVWERATRALKAAGAAGLFSFYSFGLTGVAQAMRQVKGLTQTIINRDHAYPVDKDGSPVPPSEAIQTLLSEEFKGRVLALEGLPKPRLESDEVENVDPSKPLPPFLRAGISHDKFLVAVKKAAAAGLEQAGLVITGSFNLNNFAQEVQHNHIVLLDDPEVVGLYAKYHDWKQRLAQAQTAGRQKEFDDILAEGVPVDPHPNQEFHGAMFPRVVFSPNGGAREWIAKAISLSKTSLKMAMANGPTHEEAELIVAAHQRGVHTAIVLNRTAQQNPRFEVYFYLKENGVGVYLSDGPKGRGIGSAMHLKMMIVDGKMLEFGSYNHTKYAELYNFENVNFTTNGEIVALHEDFFDKDLLEHAKLQLSKPPRLAPSVGIPRAMKLFMFFNSLTLFGGSLLSSGVGAKYADEFTGSPAAKAEVSFYGNLADAGFSLPAGRRADLAARQARLRRLYSISLGAMLAASLATFALQAFNIINWPSYLALTAAFIVVSSYNYRAFSKILRNYADYMRDQGATQQGSLTHLDATKWAIGDSIGLVANLIVLLFYPSNPLLAAKLTFGLMAAMQAVALVGTFLLMPAFKKAGIEDADGIKGIAGEEKIDFSPGLPLAKPFPRFFVFLGRVTGLADGYRALRDVILKKKAVFWDTINYGIDSIAMGNVFTYVFLPFYLNGIFGYGLKEISLFFLVRTLGNMIGNLMVSRMSQDHYFDKNPKAKLRWMTGIAATVLLLPVFIAGAIPAIAHWGTLILPVFGLWSMNISAVGMGILAFLFLRGFFDATSHSITNGVVRDPEQMPKKQFAIVESTRHLIFFAVAAASAYSAKWIIEHGVGILPMTLGFVGLTLVLAVIQILSPVLYGMKETKSSGHWMGRIFRSAAKAANAAKSAWSGFQAWKERRTAKLSPVWILTVVATLAQTGIEFFGQTATWMFQHLSGGNPMVQSAQGTMRMMLNTATSATGGPISDSVGARRLFKLSHGLIGLSALAIGLLHLTGFLSLGNPVALPALFILAGLGYIGRAGYSAGYGAIGQSAMVATLAGQDEKVATKIDSLFQVFLEIPGFLGPILAGILILYGGPALTLAAATLAFFGAMSLGSLIVLPKVEKSSQEEGFVKKVTRGFVDVIKDPNLRWPMLHAIPLQSLWFLLYTPLAMFFAQYFFAGGADNSFVELLKRIFGPEKLQNESGLFALVAGISLGLFSLGGMVAGFLTGSAPKLKDWSAKRWFRISILAPPMLLATIAFVGSTNPFVSMFAFFVYGVVSVPSVIKLEAAIKARANNEAKGRVVGAYKFVASMATLLVSLVVGGLFSAYKAQGFTVLLGIYSLVALVGLASANLLDVEVANRFEIRLRSALKRVSSVFSGSAPGAPQVPRALRTAGKPSPSGEAELVNSIGSRSPPAAPAIKISPINPSPAPLQISDPSKISSIFRAFWPFLIGLLTMQIGVEVFGISRGWLLREGLKASAGTLALVTTIPTLVSVLASPVAGYLADRFSPVNLMRIGRALSVLPFAALFVLNYAGFLTTGNPLAIPIFIGLAGVAALFGSVVGVSSQAFVALHAKKDKAVIRRLNFFSHFLREFIGIGGPFAAGYLVMSAGNAVGLTIYPIALAATAVAYLFIRYKHVPAGEGNQGDKKEEGGFFQRTFRGMRDLLLSPRLRWPAVFNVPLMLSNAALYGFLALIYTQTYYPNNKAVMGWILGSYSLGGLFAGLTGILPWFKNVKLSTWTRMAGASMLLLFAFLIPYHGVVIVAMGIMGLLSIPAEIALFSAVQERADREAQGRVSAALGVLNGLAILGGIQLLALIFDSLTGKVSFVVFASVMSALGLLGVIFAGRVDDSGKGPNFATVKTTAFVLLAAGAGLALVFWGGVKGVVSPVCIWKLPPKS